MSFERDRAFLEANIATAIEPERSTRAGAERHHAADEDRMVACLDDALADAVEDAEAPIYERRTVAAARRGDAVELSIGARGEDRGELALRLAEDVDPEPLRRDEDGMAAGLLANADEHERR